jgi:hypothetical protein
VGSCDCLPPSISVLMATFNSPHRYTHTTWLVNVCVVNRAQTFNLCTCIYTYMHTFKQTLKLFTSACTFSSVGGIADIMYTEQFVITKWACFARRLMYTGYNGADIQGVTYCVSTHNSPTTGLLQFEPSSLCVHSQQSDNRFTTIRT